MFIEKNMFVMNSLLRKQPKYLVQHLEDWHISTLPSLNRYEKHESLRNKSL